MRFLTYFAPLRIWLHLLVVSLLLGICGCDNSPEAIKIKEIKKVAGRINDDWINLFRKQSEMLAEHCDTSHWQSLNFNEDADGWIKQIQKAEPISKALLLKRPELEKQKLAEIIAQVQKAQQYEKGLMSLLPLAMGFMGSSFSSVAGNGASGALDGMLLGELTKVAHSLNDSSTARSYLKTTGTGASTLEEYAAILARKSSPSKEETKIDCIKNYFKYRDLFRDMAATNAYSEAKRAAAQKNADYIDKTFLPAISSGTNVPL